MSGSVEPREGRSGRIYEWDGEQYYSVTTVLNVLNKPALTKWAANSVANYVANNFPIVAELVGKGQSAAAIDLMKGSPWRQREKAADLGSLVHLTIEHLVTGEDVAGIEVDETVIPYLESFVSWVDHFKPEFLISEGTIFNREYNYAGTLDIIAKIDGLTWLIDVKSGKGVYPEAAMQVAAYSRGEFIGHHDGTEEMLPVIDKGAVLHVQKDRCHFLPVSIGKEVFDSFLYARELFRWQDDIQHRVILPEVRR